MVAGVPAEELGPSPIGAEETGEDLDQRGLPGTVGAEEGQHLATVQGEVNPLQGGMRTVALMDLVERGDGWHQAFLRVQFIVYSFRVRVIPAVDIQGGRAVRLFEGDPERATVYFEDPIEAARHWQAKGASFLHLVDLDAALGRGDNQRVIGRIASALDVPFEVGGGVRSLERAQALLELGARRVVVGTVAVRQPEVLASMLETLGPEKVVVSVDARGLEVVVAGWQERTALEATALSERLWQQGVRALIYTDVRRDGTLLGVDPTLMATMRRAWPGELIVGGGVGSDRDLEALSELGVDGVIVGKALYEGRVSLERWV